MSIRVGVLALQGAYQKHIDLLQTLGISARTVRSSRELEDCDALILPGGESTTMSKLLQECSLYKPIKIFAENKPVMGVCAGMILMANEVNDERITPLKLIPFKALRNHYGRQLHSFSAKIDLSFDNSKPYFAHFIRAPGITAITSDVEILSSYNKEPVLIRYGNHIASSFHPELTVDTRVHEYWLNNIDSHRERERDPDEHSN